MRHEKYRQWLLLSLYEELDSRRERHLEQHLKQCSACRLERDELRGFHALVDEARWETDASLLNEARAQLRGALRSELRPDGSDRWGGWLAFLHGFGFRHALVGSGCGLAGLAVGFLLFRAPAPAGVGAGQFADFSTAGVANVEFVDADASDGQVEITFDAVRPVRLKGNVNDPMIQKALAQTLLNGSNAGLRMQALGLLGDKPKTIDHQVKLALIRSMKFDENTGVRKRALNALSETVFDKEVKEALLHVLLHDENPGMRVAAISALDAEAGRGPSVDPTLLKKLEDKLDSEKNDYIRLRSKAFLEEVRFQ